MFRQPVSFSTIGPITALFNEFMILTPLVMNTSTPLCSAQPPIGPFILPSLPAIRTLSTRLDVRHSSLSPLQADASVSNRG